MTRAISRERASRFADARQMRAELAAIGAHVLDRDDEAGARTSAVIPSDRARS